MLDGLAPDIAPRLLIAIGGVAVAFLVLIFVLLYMRRRNSHLFVKGGRAREHRLLVMDAAAIDAKRRLVLIKRDNTEHLIMIGGPTDIVIETGIGGRPANAAATSTETNDIAERALAAARPPVAVRRPTEPEKPAVAQRPANPESPQAVAQPQRVPERAVRPVPVAADTGRRVKLGPNEDAERNQRRMQRQAARAAGNGNAPAVVGAAAVAAPVSSMGAVLYGEGRERPADTRMQAPSPAREAANAERSAAANAEAELDRARTRVLDAPVTAPVAATVTAPAVAAGSDVLKTLEQQLESGKVTAARAEAARQEAERASAAKLDAARAKAEADRAEAERLDAIRLEAQKAEAIRLEAARVDQARQEAMRAENARLQAERDENAQAEAARAEAERLAAARAEAMARFEAARRAQAEQRQAAQAPAVEEQQPVVRQAQWPVVEPPVAEPVVVAATAEPVTAAASPLSLFADDSAPAINSGSQERLASDFEKLLEAELEADGVLDNYPAPSVQAPVTGADRQEPGFGAPMVNPVQRDTQPITGAAPGVSIEQDMARRLGEISLNKKPDSE